MPDLFLSYSRDDSIAMGVIRDNLRKLGFNLWIDIEYLDPGTPQWMLTVGEAARRTDMMLVLCSPAARESIWVNNEISVALYAGKKIIPIWINGDSLLDAIPTALINVQHIDMRGRSNPNKGFRKLVSLLAKHFNLDIPDFQFEPGTEQIPVIQIINIRGHVEGHVVAIGQQDVEGDVIITGGQEPQRPAHTRWLTPERATVIAAGLGLVGTIIAALITGVFGLIPKPTPAPTATSASPQQIETVETEDTPTNQPTSIPTSTDEPYYTPTSDVTEEIVMPIPTTPPATFATLNPEAPGQIIFVSPRTGNFDIYQVGSDGFGEVNLIRSVWNDIQPAISPNGDLIAFSSNRDGNYEIYLTDLAGANQTLLVNDSGDDTFPTWSPDGQEIAFVSNRSGRPEIYIINVQDILQDREDIEVVQVTQNSLTEQHLSWSRLPDNEGKYYIVFHAFASDGSTEIFRVVAKRNSEEDQLTINDAEDKNPTYLSNGKLSFETNRDGNYEIYIMNANGSSQTRITRNDYDEHAPHWTSDGLHLVFYSQWGTDNSDEIYIIDLRQPFYVSGDEEVRRLTTDFVNDQYPIWVPASMSP